MVLRLLSGNRDPEGWFVLLLKVTILSLQKYRTVSGVIRIQVFIKDSHFGACFRICKSSLKDIQLSIVIDVDECAGKSTFVLLIRFVFSKCLPATFLARRWYFLKGLRGRDRESRPPS